jgi:hypothetical protein
VLRRNPNQRGNTSNFTVGTHPKTDVVAPIQELENRLQEVIAIGAPADDLQKQIQLCRRW